MACGEALRFSQDDIVDNTEDNASEAWDSTHQIFFDYEEICRA